MNLKITGKLARGFGGIIVFSIILGILSVFKLNAIGLAQNKI